VAAVSGVREVIRLELARAVDMFDDPVVELGATFGSSIAGIDRCVAELTSGRPDRPVDLEVVLPDAEITAGLDGRMATSLRRCCDDRFDQNDRARRAMQRSGWRALRIGLPITLLGLLIVAIGGGTSADDPVQGVIDVAGWVLAWLGLWYPFDKVFFYPTDLRRENRALTSLKAATVTITPATTAEGSRLR
jgi:hypothetical protein